jgi:hypothetical protein
MNAPWTLPKKPGSAVFDEGARSLKTLPKGSVQGAHLGARSLNAPLGSAIRERVRGGGGGALPRSIDLYSCKDKFSEYIYDSQVTVAVI